MWLVWDGALFYTSINNVVNGFSAECVIQRDSHQGVRVTGELCNGPLHRNSQKSQKSSAVEKKEKEQ